MDGWCLEFVVVAFGHWEFHEMVEIALVIGMMQSDPSNARIGTSTVALEMIEEKGN